MYRLCVLPSPKAAVDNMLCHHTCSNLSVREKLISVTPLGFVCQVLESSMKSRSHAGNELSKRLLLVKGIFQSKHGSFTTTITFTRLHHFKATLLFMDQKCLHGFSSLSVQHMASSIFRPGFD